MYSRRSWGGEIDPFILTTFRGYQPSGTDDPNTDPVLATVIFEWDDYHLLGVPVSEGSSEVSTLPIRSAQTTKDRSGALSATNESQANNPQKQYVCDQTAIEDRHCTVEQFGTFILSANASSLSKSEIDTRAVHLLAPDRPALSYPIKRTGYYCISTVAFGDFPYTAITEFRNAYGELPGGQISKLPFYGGLAIVYAVVGVFWAFLYVQNRRDILAVQNYISTTIGFLVVEMIATWGYYDHMNRNGSDLGSKVLVVIVAILNAFRNSLSFFLLLIVCMGFGVVHNSLGRAMVYARILGITHFVFGVIYAIASLSITPEDAGPLVLLVVLPLAATLTAFYVWTLNALSTTTRDLLARKQRVKAMMYRKLWWLILGSVLVIFAFFFLNSFTFAGQSDPDFTPTHWQTRWFILDGWLNLVYLADVCVIAYLWRPTANNRRFAMSDEVRLHKFLSFPFLHFTLLRSSSLPFSFFSASLRSKGRGFADSRLMKPQSDLSR